MATVQDARPAQTLPSHDVDDDDLIDYSDDEQPAHKPAATSAPGAEHGKDHLGVEDLINYHHPASTIHPITVLWEDQMHSLFRCNAFSDSFFLEDHSLIDTPLATIFTECKSVLQMESPASLGFYFTNLSFPHQDPVEIYEEETMCTHITLRQILDVYLQFHMNDEITNPAPLEIELRRRQNAIAVLQELKTAANEGVGYMQMQSIGSNDGVDTGDGNEHEEEYDEQGVVEHQASFEEQYADAEEVDGYADESNMVHIDSPTGEAQTSNDTGNTVGDEPAQDATQVYGDEATADFDETFDEMLQGGDEDLLEDADKTFDNEEVHGDESETVGVLDTHNQLHETSEETATAVLDSVYEETGHASGDNAHADFENAFDEHDDGEAANAEFDDAFDQPEHHGDEAVAASFDGTYTNSGQTGAEDLGLEFDDTVEESGQDSVDNVTAGAHDNYEESRANDNEHSIAEYNETYNDTEQIIDEHVSVSYDEDSCVEPVQNGTVHATAGFDDTYLESGLGFDDAPATDFGVADDEPYEDKSQSATVQGEDALVEHALSETHNEDSTVVENEAVDFSDDQIDDLLGDDAHDESTPVNEFPSENAHDVDSAAAGLDAALAGVQDSNEGNDDLILDLELDFEDEQPNRVQTNTAPTGTTLQANDDEEDLIDYSDDEDTEPVRTPGVSATESQGVKRAHDLDDAEFDDILDIKRPKIQNDTGPDYQF